MNLLPRLFIKDYQNTDNPKVRFAYGKLCGLVGIISNFILCAVKIVTGILIGSLSIVADGINNLADAGSSVITLIGFKLASIPSDKDHPFGHQRYEYITGLIVSVIVFFIGALLMKSSIEKLIAFEVIEINVTTAIISIGIMLVAIIVKLWQSFFYKNCGKKIKSTALIATSTDSLNDTITTFTVMISLVITLFYPNGFLDGVMGIFVSLFILVSGIKLIKETISPLIGEAPTKEFTEKVISKLLGYEGVLGVHDLIIHSYGPEKVFITVHVEVDSTIDVNISHDMIDNIEKDFLDENLNLVIHMDPIEIHNEEVLLYKEIIEKILFELDQILKFHDFRLVKGITHSNLIFDIVVPINFQLKNDEIKEYVDKKLREIDSKLNTVITFDFDYTNYTS